MKNSSFWYDISRVLSYNALLYFIIGERGVGKSFSAKKYVINHYLKKNKQFVYLRRYKTELKESVPKFFDDLKATGLFPNESFSVEGNKFLINKKVVGYALPLSTANILKSASFANVDTIIFDEFIIDKGCYHYLANEVEQMLDIIETIGRLRDIKVLFLGNAISITNPYFTYFNLSLPYNSDIATFKDGLIVVNYIKNEEYRKVKHESRFGRLIEGTKYGKYAIDNEFLRDSKAFIAKRTENCKFIFIIKYNGVNYGVWSDTKTGYLYISSVYDPNCPIIFTFNTDDHNEHSQMVKISKFGFFKAVIERFRNAELYFDNIKIKNEILELIHKYLTY